MLTRLGLKLQNPTKPLELQGSVTDQLSQLQDYINRAQKFSYDQARSIQKYLDDLNEKGALTITANSLYSSRGLQFPAAQGAVVADANTLDDYAEGAWTPGATFATPGDKNIVLSPAVGDYTKIGRLVIASFRFNSTTFSFTTASGNFNITGLPFTASSDANYIWPGPCAWGGITKAGYTNIVCEVLPGTNVGLLTASGSGNAPAIVAASDMPSGGTLRFRGTFIYRV